MDVMDCMDEMDLMDSMSPRRGDAATEKDIKDVKFCG